MRSNSHLGGSAFRRASQPKNDPFSNPYVQRATGKARSDPSFSSSHAYNPGASSNPYTNTQSNSWRSSKSTRAEREHAKEAAATSNSGLLGAIPTIGITLIFLMLAHGWGAKA